MSINTEVFLPADTVELAPEIIDSRDNPDIKGRLAELVLTAQGADTDERAKALGTLFPVVHSHAYWAAKNAGGIDPEDTASQTVLTIVEQTQNGKLHPQNDSSVISFTRLTARNRVIGAGRHASVFRIEGTDTLAEMADGTDTEAEALANQTTWHSHDLYNAAGLPDGQSKVLTLRLQQGLSLEDAADRLGLSYAATKALHHRAIKALRSTITNAMVKYGTADPEEAILELIANREDARAS